MIQISDRVCIVDVTGQLMRHPTKKWRSRPVAAIERLYFHHSGRLGAAGLQGVQNSARYCVKHRGRKDHHGKASGWPGLPYHLWLPYENVLTDGLLTVFRGNPDSARVYHTGGQANTHGLGVVFQGNTTKFGLSSGQKACASALIPYELGRHGLGVADGISWHSDSKRFGGSGKPSCPGQGAVEWLRAYQGT